MASLALSADAADPARPATPAADEPTHEVGFRKWLITLTVITCAIMELIDTSIVNVATRDIAGNLGATTDEAAWVITAYAVSNIVVIPLTGFLSNKFGRKHYFTFSVALFTFASFMCGSAHSIGALVLWRFIQGLGGGALLATAQTVLVETFPPDEINKANGIFGAGIVMGPALGPVLGGYLIDNFHWGWIFYVNVPIGLLATFLSWRFIKDIKRPVGRVDYLGIALLAVGIGGLQVVLEEGQRKDWFDSAFIVTTSIFAALGIVLFVVRMLRQAEPVVNLRVLANRNVAIGAVLRFAFGACLFASVFLYPLFVQSFLGWTATRTGLLILPSSLLTGMMMGGMGAAMRKGLNPKILIIVGFGFVMAYEILTYQLATPQSGEWDLFWPQLFRGVGFGFIFVPISFLILAGLKGKDIGQVAGLGNMMQLLGGAVGLAAINTFVTRRTSVHRLDLLPNISLANPAAVARLDGLTASFLRTGHSLGEAQRMAVGALEGIVSKQAAIISYAEGFMLLAFVCMAAVPIVLFARFRKGGPTVDLSAAH